MISKLVGSAWITLVCPEHATDAWADGRLVNLGPSQHPEPFDMLLKP